MMLSVVGIPIGLLIGYGIGKIALPLAMRVSDMGNMKIELRFHPAILLFSIGFSAFTVYLSCAKPGKVAGNVSPIEAVRYTEGSQKKRRKKGKERSKQNRKMIKRIYYQRRQTNRLISMAFGNLGRNKGKTGAVISALTLSMVVLILITQALRSFQVDKYLEARMVGDFMIGTNTLFTTGPSVEGYEITADYLNMADMQASSVALVADYSFQDMDSYFGATRYVADQHSVFANLMYQNQFNESHRLNLGLSTTFDRYDEDFRRSVIFQDVEKNGITDLVNAGIYGEYTYKYGEEFSAIVGLRGDWYNKAGMKFSPRVTLKYSPIEEIVIRANGGRGLRYSTPLIDNIGVFSTGKAFNGAYDEHLLEDSWTFGGNITYYLPFGASSDTYLSFDYFRTQFKQQMVVDYELTKNAIDF